MNLYSQKDPRWKDDRLGTCSDTIANSGCNLCSMSMLGGILPPEANKNVSYTNGCLMSDQGNAEQFGLKYLGRTTDAPWFMCKAETDHWKSKGVPQHFFVWRPDGMIADPLDYPCVWKKNPYHIVSYRLFEANETKEKSMKINDKMKDELKKYGLDLGDNLDEKDLDPLKESMSDMRNDRDKYKKIAEKPCEVKIVEKEVVKEVPVEVVKEVIVEKEVVKEIEVVKEVEVVKGVESLSASELLALAIRKFIGLNN